MIRSTRHLPILVVSLAATIALSACGGGSTPAATTAPVATSAPAATAAAPGGSPAAAGDINLAGAAGALGDLDNYRFKIQMAAEGSSEFMVVKPGGSLVMEGAVILKPTQAADVVMTTSDGTASSAIGYRIIGETAYINLGGDTWMSSPAKDAQSAVDSFKPDKMLAGYASLEGLAKVGDEDKNGIATEHFQSVADAGVGDMFGLPDAKWTSDVWVAKDGGFVVSALIVAEGSNAGQSGKFTMGVDVTAANDPTMKIEKPDGVVELPS